MNKLYVLTFFSLTLICCSDDNGNVESFDRTNLAINDQLQEALNDTVFYHINSDKFIGWVRRAKYFNDDIYLIDSSADRVMAFTANGEFKEYVGRSGRGPGEYLKPVSFTIYENNLFLLDQNLYRISHYKYDEYSNEFKYHKSVIHNIRMTDVCETNGDIWVYGYKDGNIIHKLSKDLEQIEFSGGDLTKYDEDVVGEIARQGHIACSDHYIYSGIFHDNMIYIYAADDGSLIDKITFDNIVPVQISKEVYRGIEGFSLKSYVGEAYNEKGNFHDILRNLTIVNNKIIAQYNRIYQNYIHSSSYLISYIIESENHSYKSFYDYPYIHDFNNGSFLTIIDDSLSYIVNRVN